MKVNAHLDVDVLAHASDDDVSVLIQIAAPERDTTTTRTPTGLQVVLDRSGSMAGHRLEGAKRALREVVRRLDPRDTFGLVVFDDQAEVVVAAAPLADKASVLWAIEQVQPGGSTDLTAGYLRGLQEARRVAVAGGSTVLIISDGHANAGETDPGVLGDIAAGAHGAHAITTTTLGYGLGYDTVLLSAIARGGAGNEHFAEDPDAAVALIAGEVTGMLTQAAQSVVLLVAMPPQTRGVTVHNDLVAHQVAQGLQVELGSLHQGEQRRLVLTFEVPAVADLGLLEIASLTLSYVELPSLRAIDVTLPINVNVVPGDAAAGRVRDPEIRAEVAYQQAQVTKRKAAERLASGDIGGAGDLYAVSSALIADAVGYAPPSMAADLEQEARVLRSFAKGARDGDHERVARMTSADVSRKSRTRGRGSLR